jgi:integrase
MEARTFHRLEDPSVPSHLLDLATRDGRIDADTRKLIERYLTYLQGAKKASPVYLSNAASQCILWRTLLDVPFEAATLDDLIGAQVALDSTPSKRGKPYSPASKKTHTIALKSFFYYLIRRGLSTIPAHEIKEIRCPEVAPSTAPEALLQSDDLKKIVNACDNFRDRAFVAVLFETGGRVHEVARMKWSDLTFDRHGARATIHDHKRKKQRTSRLIASIPHLAAWRNNYYTGDPVGDQYVFTTRAGTPLSYSMARHIVVSAAEVARIPKRVYPHLFRKSRITELIVSGCSESVVKESCWQNPNTKMFAHYLRLSSTDVDNELLRAAGIEADAKERKPARTVFHCPSCHAVCPPEADYCPVCLVPVSDEARAAQEQKVLSIFDRMNKDPRLALIDRKLEEFRRSILAEMDRPAP